MTRMPKAAESMRRFSIVFWDFDGVIKDSVGVKSEAFERLFIPFGSGVAARVREHHERNGGMSRYEKMPLYLKWAGLEAVPDELARFIRNFSLSVRQAVIDSAWVPGAQEYIAANSNRQDFFLVTATPQEEIEDILGALSIRQYFREVHGAPITKSAAIADVLSRLQCVAEECLMIGDSESDYRAAMANGVAFMLRRTPLNQVLQRTFAGFQCEDFDSE